MANEHPHATNAKTSAIRWLTRNRSNIGLKLHDAVQICEEVNGDRLSVRIGAKDQSLEYRLYVFNYTISTGNISLVNES